MGRSIRPVAMSVLFGVLFCVVLMLVMSVIITTQDIPQSAIEPLAVFAVSVGAFVAGYLCARALRANGLMYGAVCGAVLTVIVLIAGLIAGTGGLGIPALFRTVFLMLSSMLGGVIGVNTKKRRK
jgi:putative membrane protein (TIGR04086 family)